MLSQSKISFISSLQHKKYRKDTPEGSKDFVVEAKMSEWRDPDAPEESSEEFLALPGEE